MNDFSINSNKPTYLKSLNSEQEKAVMATEGPLLILAGAGAGKTKTLTHRMLHLIHKGVDPTNILAITFTNKAAKEMRERLYSLITKDSTLRTSLTYKEMPFVSTFHSLGVNILRRFGDQIGISKNFSIYDRSDAKHAVKEALQKLDYDPKQFDPGKILNAISRAKGEALTPEEYKSSAQGSSGYFSEVVGAVWDLYESILAKDKALDFDDLLQKTAYLLERNEQVRMYYQRKFKYIHIDEYQDTNAVQYKIAETISDVHKNIAVVGDIDQAIYGWRGAKISNMLRFEKDFPGAQIILLEQNYRSTKNILDAANLIIEKNIYRKDKKLFTDNESGDKIAVYAGMDEIDESQHIASEVRQLLNSGVSADEIAVLYRANFQSRVLEDAMLHNNLPYHVLGTKFFDRKEVKDLLSYIKLALNRDSGADLKRIINTPVRGIGKTTVLKVLEDKVHELSDSFKIKVQGFYSIIDDIASHAKTHNPSDVVKCALERSGLETELKAEDDNERLENAREVVTLAKRYDEIDMEETIDSVDNSNKNPFTSRLEKFIEDVSLLGEQDTIDDKSGANRESVKLMTVHASKGLEFDYVFITGLEKDLFPNNRHANDSDKSNAPSSPEDAEEERRLFYVAITRARKKVWLSYAMIRTIFGSKTFSEPSEFISDIDENLIDHINPGGGYGNFGGKGGKGGKGGDFGGYDFGDGLLSRLIEF